MIGHQLEKAGWKQGSILRDKDRSVVLSKVGVAVDDNMVLMVASQSCDIANNQIMQDPNVELSVARVITALDGNRTYNKNPRLLHTTLLCRTNSVNVAAEKHVELKAYEKISIPKEVLVGLLPDTEQVLESKQLESYVAWLAARYSRPALPTEFNDRIARVDPKDKRKKRAKSLNKDLSGIYVEITPDGEIAADEIYDVNLLGLVSADFSKAINVLEPALSELADIMRSANMNVAMAVRKESEISVAHIKRFKRFYYDDLSLKEEAPLPPESTHNF